MLNETNEKEGQDRQNGKREKEHEKRKKDEGKENGKDDGKEEEYYCPKCTGEKPFDL